MKVLFHVEGAPQEGLHSIGLRRAATVIIGRFSKIFFNVEHICQEGLGGVGSQVEAGLQLIFRQDGISGGPPPPEKKTLEMNLLQNSVLKKPLKRFFLFMAQLSVFYF